MNHNTCYPAFPLLGARDNMRDLLEPALNCLPSSVTLDKAIQILAPCISNAAGCILSLFSFDQVALIKMLHWGSLHTTCESRLCECH